MPKRHSLVKYNGKTLELDGMSMPELAQEFGTPLFLYSANTIRENYEYIAKAFKASKPLIAYSVKANTNGAIIRLLTSLGAGLDIVSGNELHRALDAGADPKKIIFAGVGKTTDEMKKAIKAGVREFNVESPAEAERLNDVALSIKKKAPVAIRINPEVDAQTHKHITTGKKENKFGMSLEAAFELAEKIDQMSGLQLEGLHAHIGSQILKTQPHDEAVQVVDDFIARLADKGIQIKTLNFGGGFGIAYEKDQKMLDLKPVAKILNQLVRKYDLELFLEPGRSIIGPAGVLLTKVEYIKYGKAHPFVIVDAAMTEVLRPALYSAYHEIYPVTKRTGKKYPVDIVGPVCESGDFLAKQRDFVIPHDGDYLAVMDTGAYCSVMSSNYNSRQRPAEVLVDNGTAHLIRRRETLRDLYRHEVVPDYLA